MRIGVPPAVQALPARPGVYRFLDSRGTVLYLGRATALRARVASYWAADLGDRRHLAPMISRVARIEAVLCESVHEAAWLERNLLERSLLERSLPRWNRTAGGQETEVYLELDERAAAPGLTVQHQPRRGPARRPFGPYLGGLRARQAAAGLNRVLPLAATGTGLTGTFNVSVSGGGLANSTNQTITLNGILPNKYTSIVGPVTLASVDLNGKLTVTFLDGGANKHKTTGFGVVLQNATNGAGFFLRTVTSPTNSGSITLTPQ